MYCCYCGTKINDEALFCEHCGARQTKKQSISVSKGVQEAVSSKPVANRTVAYHTNSTLAKGSHNRTFWRFFLLFCVFPAVFIIIVFGIATKNNNYESETQLTMAETTIQQDETVLPSAIGGVVIQTKASSTTTTQAKATGSTTTEPTTKIHGLVLPNAIVDCTEANTITSEINGTKYLLLNIEYTNTGKKESSLSEKCEIKVFQDGIECLKTIPVFAETEFNANQELVEVKPGVKHSFELAYELRSEPEIIKVEVRSTELKIKYGGWSFSFN